ncbi:MAG: universal stress protein [Aestuariivirga sp.]|uniref:universal stress protein n=1 Tax=Aestuariivirga sp. TaxID=2650926 RepID=UPI0025BD3096|nr:universal stress protein [Aestuariivirga sp.]MCA3561617.1 universal stress protein [Aestuariivirga sp.]
MSYKTILVSLNEVGRLSQLVAAAVVLARETGAHVSGLYVVPAVQVYPSVGFEAAPQVFEGNRSYFKDNAGRVKQAFEAAMQREGLPHDFHLVDARTPVIADEVVASGRVADLVILSASDPEEVTGVERDFVEQTVMALGRPAIVLPYKGKADISFNEVIVGWDGGREAARAAFDALPLLKKAAKVRVVRIDPQKDPNLRGSVAGADLAEALARHGVKAEAQGYPTDGQDEGQALMRCAEDAGAGLIVMGAYGHSRLAEFIFGGATRFVLERLVCPVLMSH